MVCLVVYVVDSQNQITSTQQPMNTCNYQVLPVVTFLGVLFVTLSRVKQVTSIWVIKLGHEWQKLGGDV